MTTFKGIIAGSIAVAAGLTAIPMTCMAKENDTQQKIRELEEAGSAEMTDEEFMDFLETFGINLDGSEMEAGEKDTDAEAADSMDLPSLLQAFSGLTDKDIQELMDLLKDPDTRTQLAETLLEGSGLTEEEKEEALTYIHDFSEEDAQQLAESFWAAVEDGSLFEEIGQELETAAAEYVDEQLKEAAVELDDALDDLGKMLIDISADDIVNFAHDFVQGVNSSV